MKDPGPNEVEQLVKANELLAALLAAAAVPAAPVRSMGIPQDALFIESADSESIKLAWHPAGTVGGYVGMANSDGGCYRQDHYLSMKLKSAPAPNDDVKAVLRLNLRPNKLIRWRLVFAPWIEGNYDIDMAMNFQVGDHYKQAALRFRNVNRFVEHMHHSGTFEDLPGVTFENEPEHWNYIDWAVNFDTGHYGHVRVNAFDYDLTDELVYSGTGIVGHALWVWIKIICEADGVRGEAHFADQLITPELNP